MFAQTGPVASVTSVSFTYTLNTPASLKSTNTPFTVTLPSTMNTLNMTVVTASNPQGWFSVTPGSGKSPLVLTVTANPTTLDPGNHSGSITIDTVPPSGHPAVVAVNISISGPPSTIKINSPSWAGSSSTSFAFSYVTGAAAPAPLELDISSSGDVIPFSITASNASSKTGGGGTNTPVWLRVNQSGLPPNLTTSGVAISGSVVQIFVSIDATALNTLDPITSPYNGVITITPNTGSPVALSVSLQVLPGPPALRNPLPVFPSTLPATPATDPILTVYGGNFFSPGITAITISQPNAVPITISNFTRVDRTVIQVPISASYLAAPATWTLTVANANQPAVSATFTVTDPALPIITSVVSAASLLPTAIQAVGANPVADGATSVSPREIIAVFGRNLGPTPALPVTPTGSPAVYGTSAGGVSVNFVVGTAPATASYAAPLLMVSAGQINCVVPKEVDGSAGPVNVEVTFGSTTPDFPVTVVSQDPGIFTIGAVGQGQGAILNFDSTSGTFTINGAKAQAPRSSAISIYVTGMGDLDPIAAVANGAVAPNTPVNLAAPLTDVHVTIDGQPAVVTYAGSTPGAVAGLVQINAVVPPSSRALATIPITVSIGTAASLRQSQPGVTVAVK